MENTKKDNSNDGSDGSETQLKSSSTHTNELDHECCNNDLKSPDDTTLSNEQDHDCKDFKIAPPEMTHTNEQEKDGPDLKCSPGTEVEMQELPEVDDSQDEEQAAGPRKTPGFVYVLTFVATLGGFLMGYDIGIMSGSLLYVQPFFNLSTFWAEAIVSGAVGAAAVSAILGGWLADLIGRRSTLLLGSIVFSLGGVMMGAANTPLMLLLGRIVCGFGIGTASVVVPVYVAESSPVHMRGRLTSMWQMLINFGILVSSLVAAVFSYLPEKGWRYMLGLSALPGTVQFLGFFFMPESPRWLVDKGRVDEAILALVKIRGYEDVLPEIEEIKKSSQETKMFTMNGYWHLWKTIWKTSHVRRALFVGIGLLFFQQWCGINTAIYYSGTVLKMAGFPVKYAVWLVVLPNALLFIAGFISLFIVDKIGRRPLIIGSMIGTIFGLMIIAIGFQLSSTLGPSINATTVETYENGTVIQRCHKDYTSCDKCVSDIQCGFCYSRDAGSGTCLPSANEEHSAYGRCISVHIPSPDTDPSLRFTYDYCPTDYNWITVVGVALFVFLFSPGMAPMPWTINAEIYPLWARGTCTSLAAATAWSSNLIISFTFLSLIEAITTYGAFWMFTGFSILGLIFFEVFLPETKGKCLEEVEELFMSATELEKRKTARDAQDRSKY